MLAPAVASRQLSAPQSFAQLYKLVQQEMQFLDEVVSASTLALDAEAASYFLIMATLQAMPEATELTGQLRGFGAGMLAKPEISTSDRTFIARTLDQPTERAMRVETLLGRASAADPAVTQAMAAARERSRASLAEARRIVQTQLLEATAPGIAGTAYFDEITRNAKAQHALADAGFELLRAMLQGRVDGSWRGICITAGLGLLAWCAGTARLLSMVRAVRQKSTSAITVGADRKLSPSARLAQSSSDWRHQHLTQVVRFSRRRWTRAHNSRPRAR